MLNVITGLLGEGTPPVTNSYESIQSYTLTGSQSTVTFSSIPSTYKHLQLRAFIKGSAPAYLKGNFNSDTGANYSWHELGGIGSGSGLAGAGASASIALLGDQVSVTNTSVFGVTIIDILDYADTNKYKTTRALSGHDANGSGGIFLCSSSWRNTAAISTIALNLDSGTFSQYSSFALYGIKG